MFQTIDLKKSWQQSFKPIERLTISEWADAFRYLSSESSAEAGKWRTSRAEYQRGMMDAISEPTIETVTIMTSSQVGKTEIINNIIGYYISHDPAPILVVNPTLEMCSAWSLERLTPMIRDTEILNSLIDSPKAKDKTNTILKKNFPGGHITIAGANSPSSLSARAVRVLLLDEVDRYPATAGAEGDPVKLAIKRTQTFWNRKIILASTPTVKGVSRIEFSFEHSDKRFYFVNCPHCNFAQTLKFGNLIFNKENLKDIFYRCEKCSAELRERDKIKMVKNGNWIKQSPEVSRHAGFFINELYSPWSSWQSIAENFLEAKKRIETLRVFINTSLGESFEDSETNTVSDTKLATRIENYKLIPSSVGWLTCGVDVQDDRLHLLVKGWHRNKSDESWFVNYKIIPGSPAKAETWQALDFELQKSYETQEGLKLPISATFIDSGGHFTSEVYKFVKKRHISRIYAIKGMSGMGRAIIGKPSKGSKFRVLLFPIGVDTAKELIFARLNIDDFGAGYMHFNQDCDQDYFRELTAERQVTKFDKGIARKVWQKIRTRNEALDCEVYALAAWTLINPSLKSEVVTNTNQLENVDLKTGEIIEKVGSKLVDEVGRKKIIQNPFLKNRLIKNKNWIKNY